MDISKTRKEKTVIAFFALTLVVIVAMAVINPKPNDDHAHEDEAGSASMEEKIAEAKEKLKDNPDNVHALIYYGDLLMDNNQLKESISTFDKVLKIEPENTHAMNDLGTLYQRTGFYDKSFEIFKAIEKIEPENLSAIYNLGLLNRYYKKDNKEALKYFEMLPLRNLNPELSKGITKEIETIKAEMK